MNLTQLMLPETNGPNKRGQELPQDSNENLTPHRTLPSAESVPFGTSEAPATSHANNTSPQVRNLQIEETGDFFRRRTKPKIRLMGYWLERAGFKPGARVLVLCLAPGLIELRSSPIKEGDTS
jgi:hypothetical protein